MILKRISILNYKNLEQVELNFSAKLNCFFGQNGMGKTNLLDAVYFLSFCKSAGNPIDSQNIRHEQDFFVIQGFYEAADGTPEEIYCGMKRRSKKQFKRNKKEYSRLSDHIGFLPLEKLSGEAKKYIAPLPIDYEPDEAAAGMFGLMMMTSGKHTDPENVAKAQALKDATMGWFIAQNLKSKFVHLNGNYHSDFKKGIITYLNKYRPGLKIATVCSVRQDDIKKLGEENEGRADFYICVPTDMTMTY